MDKPREISRCLTGAGTQDHVEFKLSETEELISSLQKPAFSILYHGLSVPGLKMHFVVDQSCISNFLEGLEDFLDQISITGKHQPED